MLLTKEQIVAIDDIPFEDVEVPEWGGTARVQGLSGAARDAWETEMFGATGQERNLDNARAKLVARCLVDEDFNRLFGPDEIDLLGSKSAKALDRVFAVCKKLNGIDDKDMEEMVGNSKETQGGASSSD